MKLRQSILIAVLVSVAHSPAFAADQCNRDGMDLCAYSKQVAAALNANKPKIGKYFSSGGFTSHGTELTAEFRFLGNQSTLNHLLASTNRTQSDFNVQLDAVSSRAACMPPVKRLVSHGGTVDFIYVLSNGKPFHRYVASQCV